MSKESSEQVTYRVFATSGADPATPPALVMDEFVMTKPYNPLAMMDEFFLALSRKSGEADAEIIE